MSKEKTINYSDTEKKIVTALAESADPLTLHEISDKIGQVLTSGNINALVKKGNIRTCGDRVIVCPACGSKKTVKEYLFLKPIV